MQLHVIPKVVFRVLLAIIFVMLLAHGFALFLEFGVGSAGAKELADFFHFDRERNFPTVISAFGHLSACCLLFLVGYLHRQREESFIPWFGLAVIFLFLSFDEVISIHERLDLLLNRLFEPTGFFRFAWVIPYGILCIVMLLVYGRFLLRLPRNYAALFVLSGAIFVSGAIGMEMVAAKYYDSYGTFGLVFNLMATLEELLEMLGIAVFIAALLGYLRSTFDLKAVYNAR